MTSGAARTTSVYRASLAWSLLRFALGGDVAGRAVQPHDFPVFQVICARERIHRTSPLCANPKRIFADGARRQGADRVDHPSHVIGVDIELQGIRFPQQFLDGIARNPRKTVRESFDIR